EVPTWVIFEIGILARRGTMRSEGADDQRVAICRGLGYTPASDGSAGSGIVFDDNCLTERLCHVLADQPRDDIACASSRERNDQGDVAVRIVGCCRRRASKKGDCSHEEGWSRCPSPGHEGTSDSLAESL